ncbi:MAG: pyridoxal-phosphate dependent enzyme [Spirochaetales bacterium]|nr:pyridoxal-phosphate dependent enzyme [Spirochaetales bacterium]
MERTNFCGYRCSLCGEQYAASQQLYLCPKDQGCLDVVLDTAAIRKTVEPLRLSGPDREPSHWRYLPLLPLDDPGARGTPLRRVGWTPLYELPALRAARGLSAFWLKDESSNPTASFKDRASSLVTARAVQIGAGRVVTASTGNAGAALAGMAAALQLPAVVFAPKEAPAAKIGQMLAFGATVILVEGNYDQASALSIEASRELGWYCRNTGYNPFTAEGKKTAAFEIWEAVRQGRIELAGGAPLAIFVSVGDGNIISGLHKGFRDLSDLGWLEFQPRLYGVQAEGSAAIARAFDAGRQSVQPVRASTIADSICVDMPADGARALRAVRETGGSYITVGDRQILQAVAELGRFGVFVEPAAAASYAGFLAALECGRIAAREPVVVLATGSGLKDITAVQKAVPPAPVIEPSLQAVKRLLRRLEPRACGHRIGAEQASE